LQNLFSNTHFPDSLYKLIVGFQYKKVATTKPKAIRPIPTPLATPLQQAIVPAANKSVDESNRSN
jgi:hypothetical protein